MPGVRENLRATPLKARSDHSMPFRATLTAESRKLLRLLQTRGPQSTTTLAELTGRHAAELRHTLARLLSAGFVKVQKDGRRRVWAPIA